MTNQLNSLKDRILKNKSEVSVLTNLLELIRELGCFGDIMGRDFEIFDTSDNLVYTVRQKPMAIKQMNTLLKELSILKTLDAKREASKWGNK